MESKEEHMENKNVEKFLSASTFEESIKNLKSLEKKELLTTLLQTTNMNYDEESKKQLEFWELSLEEEFKKKKKNDLTPEFIIALNNWSIFVSLDKIMPVWDERYSKLRDKLQDEKIDDMKSIMKFQMNFGLLVSDLV